MKRRRTRSDGSARTILMGIVGFCVIALGLVFGVEFLASRAGGHGDHSEATITKAPDDHPTATTSGGAKLHFSTTSIDLGLVPLGKQVGYSFSFANVGAKTLRIGDVNVRAVKGC